ncbi:CRISP/Allergen/PR-1-like [Tachypleus tridentatus]|uniref:CRISP/Allergen/PR-1-like n=1 Tax=Tachypleus tridentatus TaxID=6853 RepID=UPI003FD4115F
MAFVYYVLLAVGVPLIQSESVKADTCPSLYMRFNKSPTFCLAPKSSCSKASSGVSKDQKTEIVNTHNSLRNRLALGQETTNSFPGAADMLQMVWDEELAGIAQKHSDQCVYRHDCRTCRQVGNFSVGQNLYTLYTSQNTCPPPNWTTAINSWYSEVKDMPVSYISPFKVNTPSDKKIGHFTQAETPKEVKDDERIRREVSSSIRPPSTRRFHNVDKIITIRWSSRDYRCHSKNFFLSTVVMVFYE